jgi:hypothetical protein
MARHAEHWRPRAESGQMVIFGPVPDASGSWGPWRRAATQRWASSARRRMAPYMPAEPTTPAKVKTARQNDPFWRRLGVTLEPGLSTRSAGRRAFC